MKKLPPFLFDANLDDKGNILVASYRVWELSIAEGASIPTYVCSRDGYQFRCAVEMYSKTKAGALRKLRKECSESLVGLRKEALEIAKELKLVSKARLGMLKMLKEEVGKR